MANTTWNVSDKTANVTLSGTNNLVVTQASTGSQGVRTIDKQVTGKFYFEFTLTTASGLIGFGITTGLTAIGSVLPNNAANTVGGALLASSGSLYVNGTSMASGSTMVAGNVGCVALDLDNKLIWFRLTAAGNWNNAAGNDPATRVGGYSIAAFAGGAFPVYALCCGSNPSGSVMTTNMGDSGFAGAVPSGFTPGFTSGAVLPVNDVTTQISAEQWLNTNPQMQTTQAVVEQWLSVQTQNPQMIVTSVLLEEWASVAEASTAQQARAMILA